MTDKIQDGRSWGESIANYIRPRVIAMLFLGFSAGLPFLLVFSTLTQWFAELGVKKSTIGFVAWIGIMYSIKVFWAPVVDRVPIPVLTRLMGRRRSWMLVAMIGIAAGLTGMIVTGRSIDTTSLPPDSGLLLRIAGFALLVAFSSATQDIAIDAWRIEAAPQDQQGYMAANYQLGYRIAILVSGAGAFYLADIGIADSQPGDWPFAYSIMAVLTLVGMATAFIIPEPDEGEEVENARLREARALAFVARNEHMNPMLRGAIAWSIGAILSPFMDFFQRYGRLALIILGFIALYRISDLSMGAMANPFYREMGYSRIEVANISKIFGFGMVILGAMLGGLLVSRWGTMRTLMLGAVMVAVTNLFFAAMAWYGKPEIGVLMITISADNISAGLAGSAFIAYLSGLTNAAYTATQYALFSSLMTLVGKFISGFSGVIVEGFGFIAFFCYASALGIPAILLVAYLMGAMNIDREAQSPEGGGKPAEADG